MIIEQIQVTGMAVFCYIIGDEKTGEAALIDPAGDFNLIFSALRVPQPEGYHGNQHPRSLRPHFGK